VNYVRALQGAGGTTADTMPAGYPGENGAYVPGPTRLAPTRPVPHRAAGASVMPRGTVGSDSSASQAPPAGGHE
jgi:hypothetical protein